MSVSIFSYRGEVTVGLMVDATLIPDPDQIVGQLRARADGAEPPRSTAAASAPVEGSARPRQEDHGDGIVSIDPHGRLRVVIGGGGVAAIEALLALRALCGRRVEVTVIAPEREFIYRPVTVAEAFDRAQARTFDLADLVGERAVDRIVWDTVIDVDSDDQTVADRRRRPSVRYDALVVATGAVARDHLPGRSRSVGAPTCPRFEGCWTTSSVDCPLGRTRASRPSGHGRCRSTSSR